MSWTGWHADAAANAAFYRFWVGHIRRGWRYLYGQDLEIAGETPFAQFQSCRIQLKPKLADPEEVKRWEEYLDVSIGKIINDLPVGSTGSNDGLPPVPPQVPPVAPPSDGSNGPGPSAWPKITEIDDLTPNQFSRAVLKVAYKLGKPEKIVRVDLPTFLRACLHEVAKNSQLDIRTNVGANRHFPRMFSWLREVAEDSEQYGELGLKIQNLGGAGRVAAEPSDPKTLRVSINQDYLYEPDK